MFEPAPELPSWLQAQFPFPRKVFTLTQGLDAGKKIHFVDQGAGQPVFLMHGNPTWSFLWRKVIQELDPKRFRCIAPDLLGLGLSSRLPSKEDHQLGRHIHAIAELFEALELQDVILVGQDWGGPVVTGVGAQHPDRIAGIVLGNTSVVPPRNPRGTLFHRFSRLPILSDLAFSLLPLQRVLHWTQGDKSSISGDVARAYRWVLEGGNKSNAALALARMVPNGPQHPTMPVLLKTWDWLETFSGPMALVWGEKDPILGGVLKRHQKMFPRANVTKTQAGHFLQEEVPRELADAIRHVADQK